MASSSSSVVPAAHVQEDVAPLPLIRCPRCNHGVTAWFISNTVKNPGRHFYKCEHHGTPLCNFWKWGDKYIEYLVARWGHVFAPHPPNVFQAENKAILLQNQAELKNIKWIMIGLAVAAFLFMAAKY